MKVLLVEDSATVRAYVERILRGAPDLEVLPPASDGATGIEHAVTKSPDIILMDLDLPVIDGVQAIEEIMRVAPCPIVVLSAYVDLPDEGDRTFEALQAGAVDVLRKPRGLSGAAVANFNEQLLRMIRLMVGARVMRRIPRKSAPAPDRSNAYARLAGAERRFGIVVIGASTGGPPVLHEILRRIPRPFHLPIVVSQHIMPGFEHGLASWLGKTGHCVAVARSGEAIQPGRVHIAPADKHLAVRSGWLEILPEARARPVPSVDVLFQSTADSFGPRSVAVLLSGMGRDGTMGMLSLRKCGGLTLTQSAETCMIDSMPRAARARNASCGDLGPQELAEVLTHLARSQRGNPEE
jgi:two-component system chemotaxis response regulator CheB